MVIMQQPGMTLVVLVRAHNNRCSLSKASLGIPMSLVALAAVSQLLQYLIIYIIKFSFF